MRSKGRILVIDDEADIRKLLVRRLEKEHYRVMGAGDARTALECLERDEFDVICSDVMLGNANGLELIPKYREKRPGVEIIMMTSFGSIEDGVRAIKAGAFDYVTKGDELNVMIPVIERALEKGRMASRIERLESQLSERFSFENLIGQSARLHAAVGMARKVADTDTPVLLAGETGTGKEIFAQAIHQAGPRAVRPFVAVNCSAFARDLLESEMFGYKAGAFTGATQNKRGLFEEADEGTLFLDEIGEMDINLQAKLLRALESQSFIKAGDTQQTEVDVRIIAATNRDLSAEIREGNFREDLYYRISVMRIEIPPLRERPEDLPLLIEHFVDYYARKMNRSIERIEDAFVERLNRYHFPGNVRELRNVIERAVILSDGKTLGVDALPPDVDQRDGTVQTPSTSRDPLTLAEVERRHIQQMLQICDGNKTRAAEALGIGAATLYRKLNSYQL